MRFLPILSISFLLILNCGKNDFLIPESAANGGLETATEQTKIKIETYGGVQAWLASYYNDVVRVEIVGNVMVFRNSSSSLKLQLSDVAILGETGTYIHMKSYIKTDDMFKVGANQVVGPQQPAIEDASGSADTERKLNLLLEVCREHGLIAREGTGPAHEQRR